MAKQVPAFLNDGGEMGALLRAMKWNEHPLGKPENWPGALKIAVGIMLSSRFPMLICWGPDYIQLYNDSFRPINGISKHPQALGGMARDTYSEIWSRIGPMFADVMKGQSLGFPNFMVPLNRNGYLEDCTFDFSYSPVKDEEGNIGGILVVCVETTGKIAALLKAGVAERESEKARIGSEHQRERLNRFFMQAPAGICILDGAELIFELVNPLYQQLFPGRELLGKPVLEAVPEIKDAPIYTILQEVLHTGKTYEGKELLLPLARTDNGPVENRYFDFIYQARLNQTNVVDGILVFVTEVTEKVFADKALQNTADTLRLAMDTANMGTWFADLNNDTLKLADRSRAIHGIPDGVHPTLLQAAEMIPADDRQRVLDEIFKAVELKAEFDIEYQIYPMDGGKPKWIRSTGMGYYNHDGITTSILGTIFDITEQKEDELRKNDFIGMVSHELKTPLTSLTPLIQLASVKLKNNPDKFLSGAMETAASQVKKMTKLINGFLNISRLDSSKIMIIKEQFYIDDTLEEIIKEIQFTTSIAIHFDGCSPVSIYADRDKIGSVVTNLLSNAIKYSPNSKIIDVKCTTGEGMVVVSVQDYGLGVKRQDREKLFERYYRVSSNSTHTIAGFGIGLYLSAEIIHGHGGNIWLESDYGFGSTFYFSLPLKTN